MVVAGPPPGVANPMEGVSAEELQGARRHGRVPEEGDGLPADPGHASRRRSAIALNDSPAGWPAWIVEKFRTWSDCGGDVEKRFSKDELLTNIMIYWVTETINSSMRLYCETMRSGRFGPAGERVMVPTGCSIFPKEIYPPAAPLGRSAATTSRSGRRTPSGGHFAALEEPAALVEDLRSFFRKLR